jgi:hypothetical protein
MIMATVDREELEALARSAARLADALVSADEENDDDEDQELRVRPDDDDDDRHRVVMVGPPISPRVDSGSCWKMADGRVAVVYPGRRAAHAELSIMLRIIRNTVANLPGFEAVEVDPVLAPPPR